MNRAIFSFFGKVYSRNIYAYFYWIAYLSFLVLNLFVPSYNRWFPALIYLVLFSIITLWNEDKNFRSLYEIGIVPKAQFQLVKFLLFTIVSIFNYVVFDSLINHQKLIWGQLGWMTFFLSN